MTIEIRPAELDDIEAIGEAHLSAWRVGYRGLFADEYLNSEAFEADRRNIWRTGQWRERDDQMLFVGSIDRRVVAFAFVGPDRQQPTQGEVYAFYAHPDAWGTGVATPLMEAAEQWLRERGFSNAILWALRDNPRARRFYEKAGWSWSGIETTWEGKLLPGVAKPEPVADVQYLREL